VDPTCTTCIEREMAGVPGATTAWNAAAAAAHVCWRVTNDTALAVVAGSWYWARAALSRGEEAVTRRCV
jgi:hypothetical protein